LITEKAKTLDVILDDATLEFVMRKRIEKMAVAVANNAADVRAIETEGCRSRSLVAPLWISGGFKLFVTNALDKRIASSFRGRSR
jgi:hypothetical protein